MSVFQQAKLLLTVAELEQLPATTEREVAFAGRSNAGKSSAINALTHRRRLAFVAKQPGKTRTIQLYEVASGRILVDLPGYGYARVSEAMRRQWSRLVDGYLATRQPLKGLILIMDSRHPLMPMDEHLLRWFCPRLLPVHILLTKSDKLSSSQARDTLRQVEHSLAVAGLDSTVQLFSSLAGTGVTEAQDKVAQWLCLSPAFEGQSNSAPKIRTPG